MRANLNTTLEVILVGLMAAMLLDVLFGVGTRYIIGHQASWTEEFARICLIWIGTLGAAYVSGRRGHLSITLVADHPRMSRCSTFLVPLLVITFVTSVMVVGGVHLCWISWSLGQVTAALQLPLWLIYFVVPFSGLVVLYYEFCHIYELIVDQKRAS